MSISLSPDKIVDLLTALINAGLFALIATVLLRIKAVFFTRIDGIYEVLDFNGQLELCDAKGKVAVYKKTQHVRFLQDNVIAYQDQAFGDGDIFADYACSPGVPVDRYQEGYRYRVLISLRQTKNRGDIEKFYTERRIENGFMKADGYLQTNIDHHTENLSISIVFPVERKPIDVFLVEQTTGKSKPLGAEYTRQLPNGNWLVEWSTKRPKRFESYIMRWNW